jgi:hypothetical protein
MTMVLTIAALDFVGMVDIWILGRADLQLRFSSRICGLLRMDCGCMCVHGLIVMMVMVMMVMVMTAMVMVAVMVIIVPEALRQVGWLRQR